jgi:hypothetical protein
LILLPAVRPVTLIPLAGRQAGQPGASFDLLQAAAGAPTSTYVDGASRV